MSSAFLLHGCLGEKGRTLIKSKCYLGSKCFLFLFSKCFHPEVSLYSWLLWPTVRRPVIRKLSHCFLKWQKRATTTDSYCRVKELVQTVVQFLALHWFYHLDYLKLSEVFLRIMEIKFNDSIHEYQTKDLRKQKCVLGV